MWARYYIEVQVMLPFSDVNDSDGQFIPIHAALINCNEPIVKLLVDNYADLEKKNVSGSAPLHITCKKGNLGCVSYIVKGGANTDVIDTFGNTCLHICAAKNLGDIANFLIDNGANAKIKNMDGLTPSTIARVHRSYDVIQATSVLAHY